MRAQLLRKCIAALLSVILLSLLPAYGQTKGRSTASGWKLATQKNAMDGTTTATLSLASDARFFGHPVVLQIRCLHVRKEWRILAWFIYEPDFKHELLKMGGLNMDTSDMRIKLDDGASEDQAPFYDHGERGLMILGSEKLISRLIRGHKLLVEFTPLDRPKQIAAFTLRDIAVQIKQLPCLSAL